MRVLTYEEIEQLADVFTKKRLSLGNWPEDSEERLREQTSTIILDTIMVLDESIPLEEWLSEA